MDYYGLEYLKREIKRNYKRYIGERTDAPATMLDVAKHFNIPIDENRLEDFSVKNIDYKTPSIEIIDNKNEISYVSTYTGNANLLNYYGPTQFISVVEKSNIRKIETLYYIGKKTPIISRMTFENDDYKLTFEKESLHNVGMFVNDGSSMNVSFFKKLIYEGKEEAQLLLSRIYKKIDEDVVLEQIHNFAPYPFIAKKVSLDKYVYTKPNNIIYGIGNLDIKDLIARVIAVCFEDTNANIKNYLPSSMDLKDYPKLQEESTKSAMIFRVITEEHAWHILEIYKSNESISITYKSEQRFYGETDRTDIIADEEYTLKNLSTGTITSEEIKEIINSLQTRFGDDIGLKLIFSELDNFATNIDIRKGLIEEELDLLSPKLLIDKSFEEISTLVNENKDNYFGTISRQYETLGELKQEEKVYVKTLKPATKGTSDSE